MIRPKRRLAFRGGVIAVFLLVGIPVWVVGRAYRRECATHDLAIALFKNDTKSALAALRAGADPNARRFEHEIAPTPGQTLRRFLQQLRGGKTLSDSEPDHRPPMLALAAKDNNTAVVQALLKDGAVPDAYARYAKVDEYEDDDNDVTSGETALMWAAAHNNLGMAKTLLDRGANPNCNDTHLCMAPLLQTTSPELMEALLAHGADIHVQLKRSKFAGVTPLRFAVLDFLVREEMTARSRQRCYRCLDVLLAHGADINETTASPKDHPDSVYDTTALQMIAMHGEPADVRYLLAKGADPYRRDYTGWDALGHAIEDGMTDNMRVLLSYGVDPNTLDRDGNTPLFHAVEQGEDEPVRALIAAGAKVNLRDKHGKTVLRLAEEDDNGTVADILRAAGARR